MEGFSGAIEADNLIDIIQFYVQLNEPLRLCILQEQNQGNIWLKHGKLLHASSNNNFGIDAFYEIMLWKHGTFKVFNNEDPETESINRPWNDLVLEYFVLVDENKVPDPTKKSQNFSNPIIDINQELDFSILNESISQLKPRKNSPSKPNVKSYKSKINSILELEGIIAVALVDSSTGMSLIQNTKSIDIDIDLYSTYIVEVVKANKKFLKNLNIKNKIEDIVINLDNKYHIITFVTHNENLFIYVILNKNNSNLAMARMVLMSIEEEF